MPDHQYRVTTSLSASSGPYGGNDVAHVYLALQHPGITAEAGLDALVDAIDEQLGKARTLLMTQLEAHFAAIASAEAEKSSKSGVTEPVL